MLENCQMGQENVVLVLTVLMVGAMVAFFCAMDVKETRKLQAKADTLIALLNSKGKDEEEAQ